MSAPYHERCGMRLSSCPSCGGLVCACMGGHKMRRHYDRWGVPYAGQEGPPRQIPMGANWCAVCEDTHQSRAHRAHLTTKEGASDE